MNKRGQFYIVAAVILVIVLIGFVSVRNFANVKPEETTVYDLKKELGLETGKVVDFAIYNRNETDVVVENWTEVYVKGKSNEEVDNWIFVYGNNNQITVVTFTGNETETNEASISYPGVEASRLELYDQKVEKGEFTKVKTTFTRPISTESSLNEIENINVTLSDTSYSFKLDKFKNFMAVIEKNDYVA